MTAVSPRPKNSYNICIDFGCMDFGPVDFGPNIKTYKSDDDSRGEGSVPLTERDIRTYLFSPVMRLGLAQEGASPRSFFRAYRTSPVDIEWLD